MTGFALAIAVWRGYSLPWYIWCGLLVDGSLGWYSMLHDIFAR